MGNNHSNEPLFGNNLLVRKSNDFLSSKFRASILENKVMTIAMTRIELDANDKDYPLKAVLYPGELARLVSDPTHIYRDLKKLANNIVGHTIFLEDGNGNFKAFSIVPTASYINGEFTITFNPEIRKHILGLESNYTNMEVSILTNFSRTSSFRLYELLRKEVYKIPQGEKSYTQVEYNISELKFIIGLANIDNPTVKKMIASGEKVDWDELYDKLDASEKTYADYRDFNKSVLQKAQQELEDKSDIRFEYEKITVNRRAKKILFKIYRNTPKNQEEIEEKNYYVEMNRAGRQQCFPEYMYEDLYATYVGHNRLTKEDIDLLITKANGNEQKIIDAITLADENGAMRTNYMGFIIKAVENSWKKVEVFSGSNEQAEGYRELQEEFEKTKATAAAMLWKKTKEKEEYKRFLSESNISEEELELLYTPEELVKMLIDWKLGR